LRQTIENDNQSVKIEKRRTIAHIKQVYLSKYLTEIQTTFHQCT
jgi:hypothetical protein